MKKYLLPLIICCALQIHTLAQNVNNYYGAWELNHVLEISKQFAKPEIAEVKMRTEKKGKIKTVVFKFNTDGKITDCLKSKNDDSLKRSAEITYNQENLISSAVFYEKDKYDLAYTILYNDAVMVTNLSRTDKNGDVDYRKILKYDSNNDIIEQSFSYKKNGKVNHLWKYEYYDKGKLSHTYYYKKGKLKREYDYMCKEEGEEIIKKDFFKVCKIQEVKGDTITTIYQSTNHKGKAEKSIYKFTAKDTLPLVQVHYNNKNEITSMFTYEQSYDKMTSRIYYNNGKIRSEYRVAFSGDKISLVTYIRKKKIKFTEEKVYNETGYLISSKSYGKNKKFKEETSVEYRFR